MSCDKIDQVRDTRYGMPEHPENCIGSWDHLARYVVDVVDALDLSELARQYAGRGSDAHHPGTLLGLLIYGYASGVHASRAIERASYDSVAFRFIAGNTHPDHDTIAPFRRRFAGEIKALFVRVLLMARVRHRRPRAPALTPRPKSISLMRTRAS